uniref:Truncated ATP-binding cassette sub-family A member 2 n=1 Tax=Pectinophora gossypiella TaxID=13191 RepID=A0A6M6CAD9_PECGO|nr:truncated ATP-binding cassette sub-family A member 2 [Pectinophora gossypiella]
MRARGERKEAGSWVKFRLLMWKNFVQQLRHPVQTAAELLLPVLTMSLVLVLRSQIDPEVLETRTYPPIPAHTLNYSVTVLGGMNLTRMSMAFSPENAVLRDVVSSATTKLLLKNMRDQVLPIIEALPIEIPPGLVNSSQVYEIVKLFVDENVVTGYNSSAAMRGIYAEEEATRRVIAGIEFDDSLREITELPLDLSYALRFPERPRLNSFFMTGGRTWRTDNVFPMFEVPGPRFPYSWEGGNDPGYVNEMFIALQHMISSELVSKVAGVNLDFDVHIQRYPHPAYIMDLAKEALQFLFPSFIMISFSYTAINIIRSVTVEKEMQLKETMKIMGLPTWLHWMAWFFKQFIYLLIASVLILVILKVNWFTTEEGFSDYAVFTNTPWTVLFFFLTLYLTCTIFFCFMISGFFSKASTAALFGGVIWFLTYIPAFLLAMDVNMSTSLQAVTCLMLNSAMSYGFQLLLARESTGGMQWGDFMTSPATDSSRFVFGHVVIMMALNCVLYMLIALYLEQVLPGPYGTPKPWYFFVQRQFWCSSKTTHDIGTDNSDTSSLTKESDPTDLPIGVKIQNLKKVYGSNVAVNNLSLNIYDDQITVLLGHNGAGKSTTISMLTGNVDITSGSVTVAGYDIEKQTSSARSHIGLCPQHNVLFNELTVKEHLQFFSRLKGFSGKELDEEIVTLIEKLELQEKRDYQSAGLSGGQKRRLGVGVALCGAAKVVLLDEPTSGMDPASRRALWDLLQREKKGRSMILTTHFMDEADILGDRVAIMADGRLQCVGSPYFLKRHYGVGYTLVVVKKEDFRLDTCTELINRYIPGTVVKEDRGTEVTYSMTNEYSHVFESMLRDLEAKADEINFKNYGLLATTLEDVFMSVGTDVVATSDVDDNTTVSSSADTLAFEYDSLEKLDGTGYGDEKGIRLICQHVVAIWMKLFLVLTRSWLILLLQVLVSLVQIIATLGVMQYVISMTEHIQRRELSLAEGFAGTETLVSFKGLSPTSTGSLAKAAYESIFVTANNPTMEITVVDNTPIDEYYLERTDDVSAMAVLRHSLLIGATFDDHSATAWFSNFGYHDVAMSLAAVHAALLRAVNPAANLTVYNHPLEANYVNQNDMQTMVAFLSMQLASGIGSSLSIVSAVFIMFYIKVGCTCAS